MNINTMQLIIQCFGSWEAVPLKGLLGLITISAMQWGVGRLEAGRSKLFHMPLAQCGSPTNTSLRCPATYIPHDLS